MTEQTLYMEIERLCAEGHDVVAAVDLAASTYGFDAYTLAVSHFAWQLAEQHVTAEADPTEETQNMAEVWERKAYLRGEWAAREAALAIEGTSRADIDATLALLEADDPLAYDRLPAPPRLAEDESAAPLTARELARQITEQPNPPADVTAELVETYEAAVDENFLAACVDELHRRLRDEDDA